MTTKLDKDPQTSKLHVFPITWGHGTNKKICFPFRKAYGHKTWQDNGFWKGVIVHIAQYPCDE